LLGDLFPGLLGEFATGETVILETIGWSASVGERCRDFIGCLA
jgi:hypothetical protein